MATNKFDVIAIFAKRAKDPEEFKLYMEVFMAHDKNPSDEVLRESEMQEFRFLIDEEYIELSNSKGELFKRLPIKDYKEFNTCISDLDGEHLEALMKISENEINDEIIKSLILGEFNNPQKNIIKGNISNVNKVEIGDKLYYHYSFYKIKNQSVTLNINIQNGTY